MAVFNSTTGLMRKRRLPYVIISFVILALFIVSFVTDSTMVANLLIDESYDATLFQLWFGLVGSISITLVNFIGDGLLVSVFF